MDGVEGTLYEGERFQLLFKFNSKYPFDSPGEIFSDKFTNKNKDIIQYKVDILFIWNKNRGDIHRSKHPCAPSCLFEWTHMFIHFNGRLDPSFIGSNSMFEYIFYAK